MRVKQFASTLRYAIVLNSLKEMKLTLNGEIKLYRDLSTLMAAKLASKFHSYLFEVFSSDQAYDI